MGDYIGLAFFIGVGLAVFTAFALMVRRYNPRGDRCPHGRLVGDSYEVGCPECRHEGEEASADGAAYPF